MDITRDNLLSAVQAGLKRTHLSITGLEKQAGVPKDTVRDFLRGKTQILRADKLQKIMRVIDPGHKVKVAGYVGTGAEIFPLSGGAGAEEVDTPPGVDPADVIALRIKGDSMYPVFHDGWTLYYSQRRDIAIPPIRGGMQVPYNRPAKKGTAKPSGKNEAGEPLMEFFGKPCIVKLTDGRMMLRTLKRGYSPGRYNLISYNADDIEDATLAWAAKIVFIKTE